MESPPPILVTGATGNVGRAVVESLLLAGHAVRALVTEPIEAAQTFEPAAAVRLRFVHFDFGNPHTFESAFAGASHLFLMRPPAIGEAAVITDAVRAAQRLGVQRVAFLSIQGAEHNPLVPHHAIERALIDMAQEHPQFSYTMLRAAFFMQNLSTTHAADIREHSELLVPAGDGRTAFVDARDVGAAAARVLADPDGTAYANRAFELTGTEAVTYDEVAAILSRVLGRPIVYCHPGALRFYRAMRARGHSRAFVGVMVALYTTARLGLADHLSPDLAMLLGRTPTTLAAFAEASVEVWRA